jgi:uncharacterized protein YjbJ (UPF0337 family)
MNKNTTEGKFDQLKGKVKQSVGEAFGDNTLANSGTADQVKGAAKEAFGNAQDAVKAVSDDAHAGAEEHGHDVRSKIVSTAQNVKDSISTKAEQVKADHKRSA